MSIKKFISCKNGPDQVISIVSFIFFALSLHSIAVVLIVARQRTVTFICEAHIDCDIFCAALTASMLFSALYLCLCVCAASVYVVSVAKSAKLQRQFKLLLFSCVFALANNCWCLIADKISLLDKMEILCKNIQMTDAA